MYTVVIADDEQHICKMIRTIVSSEFPQLHIDGVFTRGDALSAHLAGAPADIVITDIEMPGKTGIDIARSIHNSGHTAYTIIITAHQDFHYASAALKYKVDAFLTKPFSADQLISEIRTALEALYQRNEAFVRQKTMQRNLISAMLCDPSTTFSCEEMHLCQGKYLMSALKCFELDIHSENLSLLSPEQTAALKQDLISTGEQDTAEYSSFYLQTRASSVTFLLFAQDEPDKLYAPQICSIVTAHTGGPAAYSLRQFNSFDAYRANTVFTQTMEVFFKTLSCGNLNSATGELLKFLNDCPAQTRNLFATFLSENYPDITLPDILDPPALVDAVQQYVTATILSRSSASIVQAAKDYIDTHYASADLYLESVSGAISVSSGYLGRIFRKQTGQRFSEYLFCVRMQHAQRLLRETAMSIKDISIAVGYCNTSYFRSSFKSHFGVTPRQFRFNQTSEGGSAS